MAHSCCAHDDEVASAAKLLKSLEVAVDKEVLDVLSKFILDGVLSEESKQPLERFNKSLINDNFDVCSIVFPAPDEDGGYAAGAADHHHHSPAAPAESRLYRLTPLMLAVFHGRTAIVQYLLENYSPNLEVEGTLVMEQSPVQGVTVLWLAVSCKQQEIVLSLLQHGAQINHCTKSGSSPIRVACFDNNVDMVSLLIKHSADVNLPNNFQNTCLMLASHMGYEEVARLLIEANADIDRQALCGATALHFSAQQGHNNIVKLLLYHGARFMVNNNGFTPLYVAAENTKEAVVNQIIAMPNLTTLEERITACELLGASYATTTDRLDDYRFILQSYTWFYNAFLSRYSTKLSPTTEGSGSESADDSKSSNNAANAFDHSELPKIAKPTPSETLPAYNYHRECQTLAELKAIKSNQIRMLFECFVILERILGTKSLILAEALVIRGAEFADVGQFGQSCLLWLRAIRIKLNAKVFIGEDYLRFIRVLERMIQERIAYHECIEQLMELCIEYYTLRPRLSSYRKLCYRVNVGNPDCFDEFTYNELKRDVTPVLKCNNNLDLWNKLDSDVDSDQVLLATLYLSTFVAKFINEFPDDSGSRLKQLFNRFCKLNVTQNISGRTLLHLAMCQEPDEEFHFNNRFNNILIRYPSVITARFLVNCGADVTATDWAYNTPLHFLSAFTINDAEARTENQYELYNMLMNTKMTPADLSPRPSIPSLEGAGGRGALASSAPLSLMTGKRCHPFYGGESGTHVDASNIFGQTAMQSSASVVGDLIFRNSKFVFSLKCFAARIVHKTFLKCEGCRRRTGGFLLTNETAGVIAAGNSASGSSLAENARARKLLLYSEAFLAMRRSYRSSRMRFPHLDSYFLHGVTYFDAHQVWHVSNRFAQKLNISLELAQFVEMHGPCKFVHFPSPSDGRHSSSSVPAPPFQCLLCEEEHAD